MVIKSRDVARLLYRATTLRILKPLMAADLSLSELARATGLPVSTVKSALQRMEDSALVRQAGTRPRAGRSQPIYAAAASLYYVPYRAHGEQLPTEIVLQTLTNVAGEIAEALVQAATEVLSRHAGEQWGVLVYADRRGQLIMRPDFSSGRTPELQARASPAFINLFTRGLMLDRGEAKSLQRELWQLFDRYRSRSGSHRYVLQAILAPVPRSTK